VIRIAVCDDDKEITASIHHYLKEKTEQLQDERLHVITYHSGVDFLHDVERSAAFHIVIMDIEMDGIDGIEVGQILRNNPNGDEIIMIYISSHNKYFKDLVRIGSFNFIAKPIDMDELNDVFSKALNLAIKYKRIVSASDLFVFKIAKTTHSISKDRIVYIKCITGRMAEIYIWDKDQNTICIGDKFYSTMDEVMKQLPKDQFVRCERSHIVNLQYVQEMEKSSFRLIDTESTKVSIGRAYKQEAKKAFFRYIYEGEI